jgi:hypothetical protein
VKAFLFACLAAIVLAAASWLVLNERRNRRIGHLPRPPIRGSAINDAAKLLSKAKDHSEYRQAAQLLRNPSDQWN